MERSSHRSRASRRGPSAPWPSPDASATAPRASAAIASSTGGVEGGGDGRELVGGGASRVGVTRGQPDLDRGAEQSGATEQVAPLGEHPVDGGPSGADIAFGEPQQREAGCGLVAVRPGRPVGGFGIPDLAAQTMQLGLLVARQAERGMGRLR